MFCSIIVIIFSSIAFIKKKSFFSISLARFCHNYDVEYIMILVHTSLREIEREISSESMMLYNTVRYQELDTILSVQEEEATR